MGFFDKFTAIFSSKRTESAVKTMENDSLEQITKQASAGNAEAQYWLGRRYQLGEDVEWDIEKALELLHRSDEQGFVLAANNIGAIYHDVFGDYETATEWFKKGMEQGDSRASSSFARALLYGYGVDTEPKKAIAILEKQGDGYSYHLLGDYYNSQVGIEDNPTLSIQYYQKALRYAQKSQDTEQVLMTQNQLGLLYRHLGKYNKAIEHFQQAAEKGLPHAMYNMATSYRPGFGIERNVAKERYWLEKAAENGLIDAFFPLAESYRYHNADGISVDYSKAVYWYEKTAESGSGDAEEALLRLAHMYETGEGVEKDVKKAQAYYEQARPLHYQDEEVEFSRVRNGDDDRMHVLLLSEDLPALIAKAKAGDSEAQGYLGTIYKEGINTDINDELAVKWLSKALENGNIWASHDLARMYEMERGGLRKDPKRIIELYTQLAEEGFVNSQFNLAEKYLFGEFVEQDYEKAAYWYHKAAEQDLTLAQLRLGDMYEFGLGVEENHETAFAYYLNSGEVEAQLALGKMFYHGKGTQQNYNEAFLAFEYASQQGNGEASFNLAVMTEHGEATKKDKKKARDYYLKAYEQGYEEALEHYERLK